MKKTGLLVITLVVISLTFGVLTFLPEKGGATTRYVGGGGPGNYTTIQSAINGAIPGDTIYVFNGTYVENIVIDRTLSLIGENRNTTTIDGNGTGDVVYVNADWVNISRLTMTNSGSNWSDRGIKLDYVQNTTISNSNISSNARYGVYLHFSTNITVANNTVWNSTYGISLTRSNNNAITGNLISDNHRGVTCWSSDGNIITDNNISRNWDGIYLHDSRSTIVMNNVMIEDGIFVFGHLLEHWNNHTIDTSNTVNGKPVYYWKNTIGGKIPAGAGQVILANCSGVTVENQNVSNGSVGIELGFSSGNILANNTISNNHDGVYLRYSWNITIVNNTGFSTDMDAFSLWYSNNNTIVANAASDNWNGIHLEYCANNTLADNTVANNNVGIFLSSSRDNTIANNSFSGNGAGLYLSSSSDNMITGNNASDNGLAVILDTSNSNKIMYNNAQDNAGYGIALRYSSNNTIDNNNISGSFDGISLRESSYNDVANNTVWNNAWGFYIEFSNDSAIANNNVSSNDNGIYVVSSSRNIIANNSASHNWVGIYLDWSRDNTVANNTAISNDYYGIYLSYSFSITVSRNVMIENGVYLWGNSPQHWNNHTIDTSNTVNGKPVYYWKNTIGGKIPAGAGQVILANCSGVTVENQNVSNGSVGIELGFSSGNTMIGNVASNNYRGVLSYYSDNNTIANNTVSLNYDVGLYMRSSNGNWIYHNDLVNNAEQARDDTDANQWDNGYPSGGNYWSDYSGTDWYRGPNQDIDGSDGIGDIPYVIDSDSIDNYPLVSPSTVRPHPPLYVDAHLSGKNLENVTVTWNPSLDESLGLIERYDVLRGEDYNASANFYLNVGSVLNGTHQFVDSFAGEGNSRTFFYAICAVNMTNESTCAYNQAGKFTRPLTQGPNLVSIPLIQSNESIETVLQTFAYDKAWFYDSSSQEWRWYMTSKGYRRGLWNVNHTIGVWVNVTRDCNLTVAGVVPARTIAHLSAGWNLVGFPSFNMSHTIADLKAEVGATRAEGYDPSSSPHCLRVLGDADVVQAGRGYWVKVEADITWTISVE